MCVWLKQVCSRRDADSLWQKHKERFDADDGAQHTRLQAQLTHTAPRQRVNLTKTSYSESKDKTTLYNKVRLVMAGIMNHKNYTH